MGLSKTEIEIQRTIRDIFITRLNKILEVERRLSKYVPEMQNAIELSLEKKVIESLQNEFFQKIRSILGEWRKV